jgi:hypothetical protein
MYVFVRERNSSGDRHKHLHMVNRSVTPRPYGSGDLRGEPWSPSVTPSEELQQAVRIADDGVTEFLNNKFHKN